MYLYAQIFLGGLIFCVRVLPTIRGSLLFSKISAPSRIRDTYFFSFEVIRSTILRPCSGARRVAQLRWKHASFWKEREIERENYYQKCKFLILHHNTSTKKLENSNKFSTISFHLFYFLRFLSHHVLNVYLNSIFIDLSIILSEK